MKLSLRLIIFVTALFVLCLSSCETLKGVPLKARVATDYGTVGYSSKGGLEVEVDQRSHK